MSSEMVRWGGLAGVGAGLMFLLSVILTLIAPPQMVVGYLSYYLIEVVLVAAFALTLVTIAGLHALQRGRYGRLGAAGFLLTFVGYALVLVSAHLITVVGGEPVSFVRFMGGLVMVVGSILLGVMTLYARVLPWWVGICAYLEGLPLAIELAAARIMMLPPQALLSRLSDRLKLLTGGPREFSERQRTLRSTIEWSYDLLEEGEKVLFGRLSIFSGGATLEATEAVCNVSGDLFVSALNGVSSLLDKCLLGHEGEAESIKRAHAEYFLALVEEAEPMLWGAEDAAWLDRLEREHDNMRAVLSWAIEHGEGELALRVGAALRWFWYMEGYYGEGRRWLEAALSKDWSAVAAEVRARALEGVGWLASSQGDLDRAQAAAEEGLKLCTEAGLGDVVTADLQNVLGDAARNRGDYEWAAELLTESLALHRKAGDIRGVAWSLGDLANVSSDRGNYEQAKDLYEEGLALSRELGGAELLGAYLISLGDEYLLEGNPERATELNEEAAELYRGRGRKGVLQVALNNLGWSALIRGDRQKAEALHEECLVLCRELGDKLIGAESIEGFACAAGAVGAAERAARLFGAAEALREATGNQQAARAHALRAPYLAAARARVDEATWSAAWEKGRTMEFEGAVVYALEDTDG